MWPFYSPARPNVCPHWPQLNTTSPSSTPAIIAWPHCGQRSPWHLARVDGPLGLTGSMATGAAEDPANSPRAVPAAPVAVVAKPASDDLAAVKKILANALAQIDKLGAGEPGAVCR